MFRKTVIKIIFGVVCCTSLAWAGDPNDYLVPGRAALFEGTLTGVRQAYQFFDEGLNTYPTDRRLKFFHAVTGTAMLVIRDDANAIDSVLELAMEFGFEVLGDYWAPYFDPCELGVSSVPLNEHDAYEIPPGAPNANQIRNIIDTSMIPQIEALIADLNLISEPPIFTIFLEPNETRIFSPPGATGLQTNVEVDYGEVLMLKGFLMALKSQLQAKLAYDLYTDPNDMLVEKMYGGSFSINADLLDPHPDFLKVLPTAKDANDGAAILAQARQDWVDSINYYLDVIDYIRSEREEDPNQEDDLLYIDPNDDFLVNTLNEKLIILRDSLVNDVNITYTLETTKTYWIYDANSLLIGQLVLVYDFPGIEGGAGSLIFVDGVTPSPWEVNWINSEDGIEVEVEYFADGDWRMGWLEGRLSSDGNSITDATFEYWGYWDDDWRSGSLSGLSAQWVDTQHGEEINFDLNPIFGSSPDVSNPRYAQPVNPRDLLPVFDEWNGPQPDTVGHGLGDDATLGGIVPDMNQYDWQVGFDLQPGRLVTITYRTINIDGNINDWTSAQIVFDDIAGDTEEDPPMPGVDIDKLYMAYDSQYLYGAITFYDNIDSGFEYFYQVGTSYYTYGGELGSIIFNINVSGGVVVDAGMCYKDLSKGYPDWNGIADFDAVAGPSAVEFKVPLVDITNIPAFLPGRFISVLSRGWDLNSGEYDDEWNGTHLKIEGLGSTELGTISGTVTYNDYNDAPIFVQAYTDPWDPEDSIVASTMITAPGPYTLEGIGDGWQGYVRAFTPLFSFNIFDLEALAIEASVPVSSITRSGVNLTLNNPTLLENNVWVAGEIDPNYEEDWYAFDAVEGSTYALDLNDVTGPHISMTLYGRDGHTELQESHWQWPSHPLHIDFNCPTSGRYYVRVYDDYWDYQTEGGTYQIRMTRGGLNVDLTIDNSWMYQNLPGATGCGLTASALITNDPMGNTSYTYEWEFILPSDVNVPPTSVDGCGPNDAFCTFAAPGCDEPNGISDSGQPFTVKVTVTGDNYGNTGTADANFGIALLGDVNNDCIVNVIDRAIITAFWRTGSAGDYCLRDCDLNCDGRVNVIDRSIVTAIWKGGLCQNSVGSPCPFRSPCP